MVTKTTIVIVTLFVGFLLYSVLNVLSTEQSSTQNAEKAGITKDNNKVQGVEKKESYWTGLPISSNNYFYVEPSEKTQEAYNEYVASLLTFARDKRDGGHDHNAGNANSGHDEHAGHDENDGDEDEMRLMQIRQLYDKYYKIIGINGILDGVNENEKEIAHSALVHNLGEYIYSKIEVSRNLTFGIELCSRNMLSKAPLHGFVWSAVNASSHAFLGQLTDAEKVKAASNIKYLEHLFHLIDNDLCYFKTTPNKTNIYASCLHGVGHGLSNIFGTEHIDSAVKVCSMRDNYDFKYLCASGIYMDLVPQYPKGNFAPCDVNLYPAACFRFQSTNLQLLQANNISSFDTCSQFKDRYMRLGCVWGYAYIDHFHSVTKAHEVCADYQVKEVQGFLSPAIPNDPEDELKFQNRLYLSCVDGFLSQSTIRKKDETVVKKTCDKFKDHKYIRRYCKKVAQPVQNYENEGEDGFLWNSELLEYDYDYNTEYKSVSFPAHHRP